MLKKFPKFLIIFFLTIFVFQIICLFFILVAPAASQAADPIEFKPQVQIPGLEKEFTTGKNGGYTLPQDTGGIAKYIRVIYKYAIGIVGILAAVVLMVGGVLWIVAGGNATAIGEAKAWIGASLTGLVIALCSYLILATVNPALVDLKTTVIQQVKGGNGCCYSYTDSTNTTVKCDTLPKYQCQNRTWVENDCAQISYCQQTPGAVTKNGCCDGMCSVGAISETVCENQYGGSWLVGTYTCSAGDPGRCVAADTTKGCCMFSLITDTKILCDARATEAECKNAYENKPGFTYVGFDNLKVCRAGVGLTPSSCISK